MLKRGERSRPKEITEGEEAPNCEERPVERRRIGEIHDSCDEDGEGSGLKSPRIKKMKGCESPFQEESSRLKKRRKKACMQVQVA